MPELDRARFVEAQQQWQGHALNDYVIVTHVTGLQAATYQVDVRQGEVVEASRDDQPLADVRTWGTWSVPGMFTTIERDLANKSADLHLRAEFDSQWGFPRRYLRLDWRSGYEVTWNVTLFEPNPLPRGGGGEPAERASRS
jgi:hypothetical protein